MKSNGKARPLAVIVGERLRAFREAKGLRQEDVAAVARSLGLPWARSSVAALERGTRELSVTEMIMIPTVIYGLGGWEEPLLPPSERIALTEKSSIQVNSLPSAFFGLVSPVKGESADDDELTRGDDLVSLGAIPSPPPPRKEEENRETARKVTVYNRLLITLWPESNQLHWMDAAQQYNNELSTTVANRLARPDGRRIPPRMLGVLAFGLWGRPIGEERDARTEVRGNYSSKRALQTARGHVTRELINELQTLIDSRWKEIQRVFSDLDRVINDPVKLRAWLDETYDMEGERLTRDMQAAKRSQ
jgi:transcriptional regulator with XRE-family HTH domain